MAVCLEIMAGAFAVPRPHAAGGCGACFV